ncbi:MAG: hypothetical protein ACREFU_01215 [Acetobacteraceae bacterium]
MCALCGLFENGTDWTDAPGIAAEGPPRQRRLRQAGHANRVLRHYRLRLDDWQGRSYLLQAPTGATELIDTLAVLWPAAERLAGRLCDPLDPDLLAALGRE